MYYRIAYVKFVENDARTAEDLADCAGSLTLESCPRLFIKLKNNIPESEYYDADCTNRA